MATVTLQPSSSGCTIYNPAPTTNYNHANYDRLVIGESNTVTGATRWLLKFNGLSDGTIPTDAKITSAVLTLVATHDYSDNARTCRVYRSKRAWVASQATWNIYATGSSWQTAGGFGENDCEQTDIGSQSYTASESIPASKSYTLDNTAIREIVAGIWANNGFLLKFDTENNDAYEHATQTYATTSYRPKLVIEYTTGPPGVKTINGIDIGNVKTINGVAIADVKSIQGIT